ncbi:MAG: phosphatidylserine decarboxylase [Verrucomicrobiota bacterium]|nr:phosphatidylserine decarboxylase [Verrucomicrobiota bacterium]
MQPIHYFNRYSGKVETEEVYGDRFLRWVYGNPLGKLALHALVKKSLFSQWYGKQMDSPGSKARVLPFISKYGLNVGEFAEAPEQFKTFNEFFYRKLKQGAREIAADPRAPVFPADGRHLGFQDVSKISGIFVKGAFFNLNDLFQSEQLAKKYAQGSMVISRLCPVDYHRFHFPVGGVPGETRLIGGPLFSVNPIALRQNIRILTENRRAWCEIDSPEFGAVAMFEVGATCVGRFIYTYAAGQAVRKGDEKGYFKFGGSLTITLFEPGRVRLAADLLENTAVQRELYARMGDALGIG